MMVELLFIACLSKDLSSCEQRSLVYVSMPPRVCLTRGEAELAKWSEDNPGYSIQRWSCRMVVPGERKT